MRKLLIATVAAVGFATSAQATTIDFSHTPDGKATYAGENITSAYTSLGVVFHTQTTAGTLYNAVISQDFWGKGSIANSPTGAYPTTEYLDVEFSSPVSNISFFFNNHGNNSNSLFGRGTGYSVYDAAHHLLQSGSLSAEPDPVTGDLIHLSVSNASLIQFSTGFIDDFSFGDIGEWIYNISDLSFTASHAVPEPASLAIIGFGLIGLGGAIRRRKAA